MIIIERFEPGATRTTNRARQRQRSGSIRHDPRDCQSASADISFACRLAARRTQPRIAAVDSHPPALQWSCSAYIAVAPLDLPTIISAQTDRTPRYALA